MNSSGLPSWRSTTSPSVTTSMRRPVLRTRVRAGSPRKEYGPPAASFRYSESGVSRSAKACAMRGTRLKPSVPRRANSVSVITRCAPVPEGADARRQRGGGSGGPAGAGWSRPGAGQRTRAGPVGRWRSGGGRRGIGPATPGPGSPVVRPRQTLARDEHEAECSSAPWAAPTLLNRGDPRDNPDGLGGAGPATLGHPLIVPEVRVNHRILAAAVAAALTLGAGAVSAQQAAPAAVTELAGVKYDNEVTVDDNSPLLNGTGQRYKANIKVYAAGLYLPTKTDNPDVVSATNAPRRMHIVMLRDIDANELGKLFTRGMQDNAPREEFARSIPGTIRLAEVFAAKKRLVAGDQFTV